MEMDKIIGLITKSEYALDTKELRGLGLTYLDINHLRNESVVMEITKGQAKLDFGLKSLPYGEKSNEYLYYMKKEQYINWGKRARQKDCGNVFRISANCGFTLP